MANINSNVIVLKTIKQLLTDGSESWSSNTRTFNINVRNEKDVILAIKPMVNIASSFRDLTVLGKTSLLDSGTPLAGLRSNGAIFESGLYKLRNVNEEIYFDVSNFNYLTVVLQLNAGQSIKTSIFEGSFESPFRGSLDSFSRVLLKVRGEKLRLRALNTGQFTSRFSIKGITAAGVEVDKTLYSPGDKAYLSATSYSSGVSSDSFVDVSDIDYILLTTTQGNFKFDYSFFNDLEQEYTNYKTTGLKGAVRGFEYVTLKPNGDFTNWGMLDDTGKEVEVFTESGDFVGSVNLNVKSSGLFIASVRNSKSLVTTGGGNTDMMPLFGYHPELYLPHITQGNVSIKKLNRIAPGAQYGRCKAWISSQKQSLEITYIGRDFDNCEYSVLLADINPANPSILTIVFIPYNRSTASRGDSVRLCIQFNDGSIYHNFPNRSTTGQGTVRAGDEARFDKSVIWDFDNRFPSMNPSASAPYYYDPTLSADNYETLVPISESNPYGNGGFPISRNNRVRFRKVDYVQALRPLNGFEIDKIYTACDTYYSTTKNGYLETSDGGREFFLQASLGAGTPKEKTYGAINTSSLPSLSGSMKLIKRTSIMPSSVDKDPAIKFTITEIGDVTGIASALNPNITVPAHGLSESDKVYFTGESTTHGFMLNNSHTANSNGNGQVYFVSKVIDANTINIEPVSANTDTNIECRHVHSLNRVHDGWVMACGEEYPYGWIIFIKQHLRDFTTLGNPWVKRPIVRLTSAENSVQRAVGFTILDDSNTDPTCIWAVDTSNIPMPVLKVGERDTFSRGSNGLRVGKFSDLDDYSKFETLVEFDDAMLGLKQWMNIIYAVGGYGGTFAVSVDGGRSFIKSKWDIMPLVGIKGYTENGGVLLTNGYIISSR